jgi:hypothetical protein
MPTYSLFTRIISTQVDQSDYSSGAQKEFSVDIDSNWSFMQIPISNIDSFISNVIGDVMKEIWND